MSTVLLLSAAGLLALSNANASGLHEGGRVAAPYAPPPGEGLDGRRGVSGHPAYPPGPNRATTSWPGSSKVSRVGALDDRAENG